jgi:uncharacterized protein (DUF849 family)
MIPMLQAALNGARTGDEHPRIPRTPEELAATRPAVDVGAQVVHVHAFDRNGIERLAQRPTSAVPRTIRASCPGVPISLTTRAPRRPRGPSQH